MKGLHYHQPRYPTTEPEQHPRRFASTGAFELSLNTDVLTYIPHQVYQLTFYADSLFRVFNLFPKFYTHLCTAIFRQAIAGLEAMRMVVLCSALK